MSTDPTARLRRRRPDRRSAGARVGRLFEEHGRMVYALSRMLLRDREEAEDATQQTFLSAHRSILAGVVPGQPAPWLATIARNECYRRLGRRPPEAVSLLESDNAGGDPSGLVDQRAEIEALCEALAELPPAQRQAVVLREFYGLSYREVAAALGVSGPAVESLLFKSRRRLQERLRHLRAASSAVALPLVLQDALAASIPGFASGAASSAGAAGGGAVIAKIAGAPAAAKLAAAVLVAGTGTAVTVAETRNAGVPSIVPSAPAFAPPAAAAEVERKAEPPPARARPVATKKPATVERKARPVAVRINKRRAAAHREREDDDRGEAREERGEAREHDDEEREDDGNRGERPDRGPRAVLTEDRGKRDDDEREERREVEEPEEPEAAEEPEEPDDVTEDTEEDDD